jgi:hypothetical protein
MRSLSETLPLSAHRASVARYLEGIEISFNSVAGRIIAERLPVRCARDPIRPCLLLWACAANGGDTKEALPVAAAFDLFDRFMLLHDELADVCAEPITRWGLGQSLNAGDALYALGFRMLASDVGDPERRGSPVRPFSKPLKAEKRRWKDVVRSPAPHCKPAPSSGALAARSRLHLREPGVRWGWRAKRPIRRVRAASRNKR